MVVKTGGWPPALRGPYERDEERPSIRSRSGTTSWTRMEGEIFNAVTRHWDRAEAEPLLFSKRLRAVKAMLDAFDQEALR